MSACNQFLLKNNPNLENSSIVHRVKNRFTSEKIFNYKWSEQFTIMMLLKWCFSIVCYSSFLNKNPALSLTLGSFAGIPR